MNVYIVNANWNYERMWMSRGHNVVSSIEQADLVQFTGGEDVSPSLYGEVNVHSYCNASRDNYEQKIFDWCVENKKPMVGICRGAQFLNVMNGGKMWQHVDNHAIGGTHLVEDLHTRRVHHVTSTHHQMMRRGEGSVMVAWAMDMQSSSYRDDKGTYHTNYEDGFDTEVLWYPDTHCLCFQPHPEYGAGECQDYYFLLIERYYGDI